MKGSIHSDIRRCACGGKYIRRKEIGYTIPSCMACGSYPTKLRIKRYLPSLDGTGEEVDIRYDHRRKRLTDIQQAIRTLEFIDDELTDGKFDPRKYGSKKVADQLKFGNFLYNRYLPMHQSRVFIKDLSPGGFKDKKTIAKNHLKPFFGEMDLADITTGKIQAFFESYTECLRMRDRAIAELRCVLKYAMKLEYLDHLPFFPPIEKSKFRDVEQFPSAETQRKIIEAIEDPDYRVMVEILAHLAIRPCEVRALKWKDLDFHNQVIKIQHHFSDGNKDWPGRKSRKIHQKGGHHEFPMMPEFIQAIAKIERRGPDEYVFPGKRGEIVSGNTLSRAWNDACEKVGVEGVPMYVGTKHARLSQLKKLGYSDEEIMRFSGHVTGEMLKRYAQLNNKQHLQLVEKIMVKARE